uniref:Methionine aminopeptidase 2 An01g11360 n=1 Tax=Anthurium amnicola TaxID=1678845 RepID=A0A1D1ZD41_9ARAE
MVVGCSKKARGWQWLEEQDKRVFSAAGTQELTTEGFQDRRVPQAYWTPASLRSFSPGGTRKARGGSSLHPVGDPTGREKLNRGNGHRVGARLGVSRMHTQFPNPAPHTQFPNPAHGTQQKKANPNPKPLSPLPFHCKQQTQTPNLSAPSPLTANSKP